VCTLADVPESVIKFVTAPRLGEVAARLLEVDAVRVLHFNGFFKPAFGVPTPLHQDMDYIPLDTDRALTIWVPLMDVTPEMGGLVFAEGSHLHGKLNPAQDARRFRVVKNEPMRVGDVSVHMGWTLHGALKNTTGIVREALAVFAYADGVRIDVPGKRPFDDIFLTHIFAGLGAGDIAAGKATPVVFRRSGAQTHS
jgi:ectoine hydroxylase-related dioxygenase (phytanoyl-CoA dioxygenase family)